MKFKDPKVLFLVFCCLLLLISVSGSSATDTNGSDVNDEIASDTYNNQHNFSSENFQETKTIKKLDSTNIFKKDNIKKEKNTTNKNIKSNQNKIIKKADIPYNVNDFNSLRTTWNQIQTSGSTSNNYIINLAEGTYTFTNQLTSTSTLHLNIIINGGNPANTIFDGEGNVRFFDIQSQDITLNNITFRNGFVQESQGGAISLSQGNIYITNSTFRNNTAVSTESASTYNIISGGALYIANATNAVLTNNTFDNNSAQGMNDTYGGAIAFMDSENPTVLNCSFIKNYAQSQTGTSYGGAIYATSGISISNSNFTNNKVGSYSYAYGGAIVIFKNSQIINSNFTNNLADGADGNAADAGAIYHLGDTLTIRNSTFNNNEAKGKDETHGGAISDATSMIYMYNSTFSNNKVDSSSNNSYGGALYLQSSQLQSYNTTFDNNTITSYLNSYGGAIYSDYAIEINNNTFSNNKAKSEKNSYGGAIVSATPSYMQVEVRIIDSKLNNNTANSTTSNSYGGAISITGSILTIIETSFENNIANATSTSYGGAIQTDVLETTQPILNINNVTFNNNTANSTNSYSYGGAIATTGTNTNVNDTKFTNNKAQSTNYGSYGGALSTTGQSETLHSNVIITNSNFENNIINATTRGYGGAISITASDLTVNNTTFTQNIVNSTKSNSYGGAIATTGESITRGSIININNTNFTQNIANSTGHYSYGGAVAVTGTNITINNTRFNGNIANSTNYGSYGGALATTGESETRNSNVTVENTTFINNLATGNIRNYGGAISTTGSNLNITKSSFTNNTANSKTSNSYGGALATTGESETRNSNVNITDTIFNDNHANSTERSYGGAISITGSNLNLKNTNFTNNIANSTNSNSYGGAIATTGESTVFSASINITTSKFENNIAEGYGKTYGGAISTTGTNTTLNNSIFTNNLANSLNSNSYGGALATTGESETRNSNVTVENTTFTNNAATGNVESYGGAISTIGSSLAIDTVNFTQNRAEAKTDNSYGGAVATTGESQIKNSDITITNSNFNDNTLSSRIRSYGGAISGINQNLKVNLTNFTNNQATSSYKSYGGAISIMSESTTQSSTLNISNATFTNNQVNGPSLSYGGAIAITGANLTLTNTTLDKNSAISTNTSYGGAVATTGESEIRNSNLTISYTTFTDNTAKIGGGIYGKNNILNLTFAAFNNNVAENSVNLADENVTLNLRGNYFAEVDSIYASNITALVNNKNAVALLNQTTTSPLKVVLVEKDSNKTITKLGNNYSLEVSSIPDDLITKVNLSVDNGYSSDVEFKPLPDDSNMKVYTENTLVAIINHDANLTIDVTTPVNTIGTAIATVTVSENGNPVDGNVIFTVNGETFNVTIVDGKAQLNYTLPSNIQPGENSILAEFENPIYNPNSITGTFTVIKLDIANTTMDETIKTLENFTINTIIKDTNGNTLVGTNDATIEINGQTIKTTITDGVLDITLPTDTMEANTYPFTVNIEGNNLYNAGKITGTLTIQKRDADVTIDVTTPVNTVGNVTANVDVSENGKPVNGNVIFTINGETYNVTIVDGKAQLNYTLPSDIEAGEYDVSAEFTNPMYNVNTVTGKFTVIKLDIANTTMDETIKAFEDFTINTIVKDTNGNTLVGTNDVTVAMNNETLIKTTITNGVLNITLPTGKMNTNINNFTITIGGNNLYNAGQITGTLTIEPIDADMTIDVTTPVNTIGTVTAKVDVSDDGKPVNGNVIFTINGETFNVTVVDGKAQLNYTLPSNIQAGEYDVVAELENPMYNTKTVTGTFTVIKIDIPDTTIEATIKTLENYTINTIIKDANGNTLVGTNDVTIEINGQTIKTTITNGVLDITIPTDTMEANTYPFTVNIEENNLYNAGKITGTLNIQKRDADLTIDVTTPVNTIGTVTTNVTVTDNGNPVNGNVIFTINGETFNVTVVDGKVQLNYTLPSDIQAGEYDVVAELENPMYNANTITGKFTVIKLNIANTTIAETIKTLENYTINTIIKDTNGNTLVGTNDVTVEINGQTIKTTITDGVLDITIPTDTMEANTYTFTVNIEENNIYNAGKITGILNIQKRDTNMTIDVTTPVNTIGTVTAKVDVSDNGNPVNGNVIFTINGETYNVTIVDGKAQLNYTLPSNIQVGEYSVSAEFTNPMYNVNTVIGSFMVVKLDIANTTMDGTIKTQENYTINTIIKDTNGNTLVGTNDVTIEINGQTIKTTITDGLLDITIPTDKMDANTYDFTVNVEGNNLYNAGQITGTLTIEPTDVDMTIDVTTPVNTIGIVTAKVDVSDNGKPVSGNIIFTINGQTFNVTIVDGKAQLNYTLPSDIQAGEYDVVAKLENPMYDAKTVTGTFTVVKIDIPDTTMDETIKTQENYTINTIVKDANGNTLVGTNDVTIEINGQTIKTTITNGVLDITLPTDKMDANTYPFTVNIGENNLYNAGKITGTLNIQKRDANITIDVTTPVKTTETVTANVTVLDNGKPVDGNVIFTINGETYNVTVVDGKAQLNYTLPSDIEAGEYDVVAELENPMYNTNTATGTFTVIKLDIANTTMIGTIKTQENYTINTIIKDTNGNTLVGTNDVTIEINGQTIKTTITNGILDITLPTDKMEANAYTFTVNIGENNIYNAGKITGTLNIQKRDTNITIDVTTPVKTTETVIANVDVSENGKPVDGNVIFTINGETYNVAVVDGKAQLNYTLPSDIQVGKYDILAEFTNPMYNPNFVIGNFMVVKLNIENTTMIGTIKTQENFTINTIIKDTNGNTLVGTNDVTIEINGQTIKTTIIDGVLNITLPTDKMEANTYPFTANIEGNNLYNAGKIIGTLNIQKRDANITMNVTTPVNTIGNVTANVTVLDNGKPVNGNVIFTINGETYNVTVVDGKAQLNYTLPSDIEAGEYNITAELENSMYNANNVTGTFTVIKLDIANTTINDTIKTLENYTINTIVKDTNGNTLVGTNNVTIEINGQTIKTTITNGVLNITLPTDKMDANTYTFTVNIEGNNLYNAGKITGILNIQKRDANITMNVTTPVNTTGNITVNVTVLDDGKPVNGSVIFKVDNETFNVTIVDGKAQLNYTLPSDTEPGEHNITAELENPMYNTNNVTGTFTVIKLDIANTTINGTIKTQENYTINTIVKDTNGNTLVGTNDVTVEINGQTIKTTITDGVLNITLPTDKMDANTYPFTVNIGENNLYNAGKITGTLNIQKRDANITMDVTTPVDTIGNITVNVTISDNGNPVNGSVIFKVDNETFNVTVVDGKAQLNYTLPSDIQAGEHNISAELENPMYNTNNVTGTFTVIKLDIANTTISGTIKTLENYTINTIIKDKNGNPLVGVNQIAAKMNGKTFMHGTIKDGVLNITFPTDSMEAKDYNLTIIIGENNLYNTGIITGKLTIQNRDVTVKVDVNNPYTLSDLLANVTVTENGTLMKDGIVIFKINGLTLKDENGNEIIANVVNGHASLNYTLSYKYSAYPSTTTGMNNFTAVYSNSYYNSNSNTVDFKITATTIPDMKFDDINILTGENTTINITVRDINNKTIVANKKIAVKINGKTIIHDNITDGKIYLNIPTDQLSEGKYNLLIIIGTNSIYSNASYTMIIDVQKRNASIETQTFTNGKTLSLISKITSNESFVDGNVVIYKLNGVTLKDEDGNVIKVNVKDGLASLDYELPDIITAIDYNLTSVYVSNFYYNRCEEVETISIPKIAIPSISLNDSIISKGQNLSISTTLKDAYNDTIKGLSNIDIKINGNSVMKTSIMNGNLNITIPTDKLKAGNYEIIIIIKEGTKYFGSVDLMNLKVAT